MRSNSLTSRSLIFSACIVGLIVTARLASAADFYVATDGNDANDGSFAAPWRTIQKAASTVTAGATVHVRSGTYNEIITPANSGTADAPITYQPDTGAEVTIDGTGFTDGAVVHSGAGLLNIGHNEFRGHLTKLLLNDITALPTPAVTSARRLSYCPSARHPQGTESIPGTPY